MTIPHPKIAAVWATALELYRREHPEDVDSLGHVVDLAREAFYLRVEAQEEHAAFDEQAPVLAARAMRLWVLNWQIANHPDKAART